MKLASSVLALAFLAALAMPPTVSAGAVTKCTPDELQQITDAAAVQGGIIHTCETDTGFTLFPFAHLPISDDQQRRVCSGRSCPTAISNLQEASLPECLVAIGSGRDNKQQTTPAEFLASICR